MGADESKQLFDKFKSESKDQLKGDFSRFIDKSETRKILFEKLIEENPKNSQYYLEYTNALMGCGQRQLAMKHIKIYWNLCDKTFINVISIISALQDGECTDMALKFCRIGRKMIINKARRRQTDDDMAKIRFYLHYAHVRIAKAYSIKKIRKLLYIALYLLDNYKIYGFEGRRYQMRLQLATDFLLIGSYNMSLQQIKPILRYKNKQYFDFDRNGDRILINKNKICKIYGELMLIKGQYTVARQYLLQVTNEKDYSLALSDYAINGFLMKCCMEMDDYNQATIYYQKAVTNKKSAKTLNNKVFDFQHCHGLFLYGCMYHNPYEANQTYQQLKEMKELDIYILCGMTVCYMACYLYEIGHEFEAILHYLYAIYLCNVRKYPEIYYHFSLCLLNVGNIISSKKYIKDVLKYNQTAKVRKLNNRIHLEYKNLECLECNTTIKTTKLKTCGGCAKVFYCSKLCQKKSWNRKGDGHRMFCDGTFTTFCSVRQELKMIMKNTKTKAKTIGIPTHNSVYHK